MSGHEDAEKLRLAGDDELGVDLTAMNLHGIFRSSELTGNLFIAIAVSNKAENIQLTGRQLVVTQVLGDAGRHLRRDMFPASVNGPDNAKQIIHLHTLQDVGRSPGAHRSLNVAVAIGGRQYDDAGLRKLSANRNQNVGAIGSGKAKIHQCHVGTMTSKFRNGLHGIGSMSDEEHVGLAADDRFQSFSKDRMILYAQDANRACNGHRYYLVS